MSRRTNKINRKQVSIQTKIKPIDPESRVFMQEEIPHKAYGSVLVVVDGGIGERIQFATNGLKVARNVPIFQQAAELAITDPYVQFYRGSDYQDEEGNAYYTLAEVQSKARTAYLGESGPIQIIANHALQLALMYYTEFGKELPDTDDSLERTNEQRKEFGLPPLPEYDLRNPMERKLKHVRYMMATDQDFAERLTESVNAAVAKIQEEGLGAAEEETSEDGFHTSPAD